MSFYTQKCLKIEFSNFLNAFNAALQNSLIHPLLVQFIRRNRLSFAPNTLSKSRAVRSNVAVDNALRYRVPLFDDDLPELCDVARETQKNKNSTFSSNKNSFHIITRRCNNVTNFRLYQSNGHGALSNFHPITALKGHFLTFF